MSTFDQANNLLARSAAIRNSARDLVESRLTLVASSYPTWASVAWNAVKLPDQVLDLREYAQKVRVPDLLMTTVKGGLCDMLRKRRQYNENIVIEANRLQSLQPGAWMECGSGHPALDLLDAVTRFDDIMLSRIGASPSFSQDVKPALDHLEACAVHLGAFLALCDVQERVKRRRLSVYLDRNEDAEDDTAEFARDIQAIDRYLHRKRFSAPVPDYTNEAEKLTETGSADVKLPELEATLHLSETSRALNEAQGIATGLWRVIDKQVRFFGP